MTKVVPDQSGPEMSAAGSGATSRSIVVLETLSSAHDGISIRAVAEATGLSRSAAHRILQSFATDGLAVQGDEGRYRVGPRLVHLAARVLAHSSIVSAAHPLMERLVAEVGETVYLAIFIPAERSATFIHRVECNKALRYVQPLGARIPLHAGAVGKAILAGYQHLDPNAEALQHFVPRGVTDLRELQAEIDRTRSRGFAISVEERVEGVAGASAWIGSRSEVIGALAVSVPIGRIPAAGMESLGPIVCAAADEVSIVVSAAGAAR